MSARSRLTASIALVPMAVVFWASPAAAHAILLRTEPSPQTTVTRAPPTVRLHFSEPVEVAFGAVRVFDVDGHRVDDGELRRADANREVDVPVRLHDGTYTVTWRVTSSDGHPVHGGFAFYVGAPSTISAAAVPADRGAGRVVGWGYGVVRFLWFSALLALTGAVAVRRWVWTPALAAVAGEGRMAQERFRRAFRVAVPAAWVVLAAAGGLILLFQTASVSGLSLTSAARPEALSEVLHTAFGRLWTTQMALTAVLALPVFALVRRRRTLAAGPSFWIAALGTVVAGLCVVVALNGHARTLGHSALDVPALAVHILAVSVWVGGLAALVILGGLATRGLSRAERAPLLRQVVPRFSRVALAAVAVVVVTGVITAFGELNSVTDLWRVTHGRVVAAKVILLMGALGLAARHRWSVPARLRDVARAPRATASFARSSAAELVILTGALALASALVALVPGRSLALAARGPVNLERAVGPYTAQLFIDPTTVGDNQVHVTFVNAQGLGAIEVSTTEVMLGPTGAPLQPLAMRLISPGHFVGDTTLPRPGQYRLSVATATASGPAATTFAFRLRSPSKGP